MFLLRFDWLEMPPLLLYPAFASQMRANRKTGLLNDYSKRKANTEVLIS